MQERQKEINVDDVKKLNVDNNKMLQSFFKNLFKLLFDDDSFNWKTFKSVILGKNNGETFYT